MVRRHLVQPLLPAPYDTEEVKNAEKQDTGAMMQTGAAAASISKAS